MHISIRYTGSGYEVKFGNITMRLDGFSRPEILELITMLSIKLNEGIK